MGKRTVVLIAGWIVAFTVALALDLPVAQFVHDSGLAKAVEGRWWANDVLKIPGMFPFTVAVAILLWLFRRSGWKCSVFVVLAGVFSGINVPVKWLVGRSRPYKLFGTHELRPFELHPFWHGWHGLFNQKDLCFPSGHACTAFALAAAIAVVWPQGAVAFFSIAVLVGLERIAENAHYCSDVVGAAGIALLGVWLLHLGLSDWMKLPKRKGFLIKEPPASVENVTMP